LALGVMTTRPVALPKNTRPVADPVARRSHLWANRVADTVARRAVEIMLIGAVALLVFPLLITISMSFDARDYLGSFPPPALSLRWYARFLSDSYLLNGLKTSLLLASAAAVIATVLGLSAAAAIDRLSRRSRDIVTSLFLAPLIVPGVVIGFALLLLYGRMGMGNGFLRLLGGHIIITFPYALRAILAALGNVRPSLTEAALSLGASGWRAFWSVTFPLARAGVAAGAVFAFAFSLDDVAATVFLSGPQNYTLPVALVSMMYSNFNLTIAAVAVIYVGFTTFLMIILDRLVGLERVIGGSLFKA
jgi:putative spermidine/putrescine transport system permease protein